MSKRFLGRGLCGHVAFDEYIPVEIDAHSIPITRRVGIPFPITFLNTVKGEAKLFRSI